MVWTNLCRIYRSTMTQDHSLRLNRTDEDIYAVDKKCRIAPSENVLFEMPDVGELGLIATPVELWFPRGIDIKVGYTVEVKKRKIVWGDIDCVNTNLSANAAIAATTLYVEDPTGIESGDIAKLVHAATPATTQVVNIKTIEGQEVKLYADSALKAAYTTSDTLAVCNYYKIVSMTVPNGMGPFIKCEGRQIAHVS